MKLNRWDIINCFVKERGFKSFLEIGTQSGITFRNIQVETKVSVDPDKNTGATYHMTSDDYFKKHKTRFDIIFIDGLHEAEQAYRDIMNALKHLNKDGVIVVHDCHPTTEDMQGPYHGQHFWTGDVWKAFMFYRRTSPYRTYTLDHDFGCGVIDTAYAAEHDLIKCVPDNMTELTYDDFINHPEWMGFTVEWKGGNENE